MATGDACELWSMLVAGVAAGFSFPGTGCASWCCCFGMVGKGLLSRVSPGLSFANPKPAETAGRVAGSRNLLCS